MQKINLDELKKVQLDVLNEFHNICINNNIKYSLGCGTLLGAIRHKGYIPWDDDIDVYLLREEYEKFAKIYTSLTEGRYKFVSLETDKKWCHAYGKFYDSETMLIEPKTRYEPNIGINIDIFPLDNVPDSESAWKKYNKKRKFLQLLLTSKITKIRKDRSFAKNCFIMFLKLIAIGVSARRLGEMASKYAQKYDGVDTSRVFETVQGIYIKSPFRVSCIEEVQLHQFEDKCFYIMSGYDEYLTVSYGDYMTLPPVDKRRTHHFVDAYWL